MPGLPRPRTSTLSASYDSWRGNGVGNTGDTPKHLRVCVRIGAPCPSPGTGQGCHQGPSSGTTGRGEDRMAGTHLVLFTWVLLPGWRKFSLVTRSLPPDPELAKVSGVLPQAGGWDKPTAQVPRSQHARSPQPSSLLRTTRSRKPTPEQKSLSGAALHSHSPHGSCHIPVGLMSSQAGSALLQGWWTPAPPGPGTVSPSPGALAAHSRPLPAPLQASEDHRPGRGSSRALCVLPSCPLPCGRSTKASFEAGTGEGTWNCHKSLLSDILPTWRLSAPPPRCRRSVCGLHAALPDRTGC